jgi:hypothetical protein
MTQSRGNWMEEKERESSAAVHGSHTHTPQSPPHSTTSCMCGSENTPSTRTLATARKQDLRKQ